ncbi:MAG: DUF433 domain-containing protein [bacterium]|nr:DUF433 domain-containing protein [bacterium]
MPVSWREHIASTTDTLHGKPRLNGTRIPVSLILGYLAAGYTTPQIIEEFPDIKAEQIAACLDYARDLAEFAEFEVAA